MKPRNLKQALEQGYVIEDIQYQYNPKCLVKLKERFHQADRTLFLQFWMNTDYMKRNYSRHFHN